MIITLAKRMGYAPSLRELKAELGTSFQSVEAHLNALREKGVVSWVPNQSRTLRALCQISKKGIFFVPGALQKNSKEQTT